MHVGKSSLPTWQPRRLPSLVLKPNPWWRAGASRPFLRKVGKKYARVRDAGVYQRYGRLSAPQASKTLKPNQELQMFWKNMYAHAPEALEAQDINSLGPRRQVMVGAMLPWGSSW